MPAPKKGPRLGGSPAHQRLILSNLATQLFERGRITTTEAKARTLRPHAEKLITKAVKAHHGHNPVHQRREVAKAIHDKGVLHHLFGEIAPRFAERPGGYTRITKVGPRKGDNAPMAVIELVSEPYVAKVAKPVSPPAKDTSLSQLSERAVGAPRSDTSGHGNTEARTPTSTEELTVAERTGEYTSGLTHGFFQRLVRDEFVHVEQQSNGTRSVMWSCAKPLEEFLTVASNDLPALFLPEARAIWMYGDREFDGVAEVPELDGHSDGYTQSVAAESDGLGAALDIDDPDALDAVLSSLDDDEDEYAERPLEDLLLAAGQRPLAMCVIRAGGMSLVWQQAFHKATWSSEEYAQASLLSEEGSGTIDRSVLLDLLLRTGSEAVSSAAGTAPQVLDEVLDYAS